jgi:hypothetical protein
MEWGALPSAVYRSEAPDGRLRRVAVTFVSEDGDVATSVAEVSWRWMQKPATGWTELQRISDWELSAAAQQAFDRAVARAFDVPLRTGVSASRKDVP